jgi:hypothetical protein
MAGRGRSDDSLDPKRSTPFLLTLFNDEPGSTKAKIVAIYAILLVFNVGAWFWALVAFHRFPVLAGHRVSGLQLWTSPRGRRGPHCRHRQRYPQADAAGQAARGGGPDVLAGAFHHRHRGLHCNCSHGACAAASHRRGEGDWRGDRHAGVESVLCSPSRSSI